MVLKMRKKKNQLTLYVYFNDMTVGCFSHT